MLRGGKPFLLQYLLFQSRGSCECVVIDKIHHGNFVNLKSSVMALTFIIKKSCSWRYDHHCCNCECCKI